MVWSDNKIKIKMTWSLAATLLLLSGDVELNPGPKKGAPKDTGPTPEQKIAELETTVKTYEEKISGKKTKMCLELQFSRPRWRWVSAATIASDRYV